MTTTVTTEASEPALSPKPPIISACLKRAGSTSSLSASSERPRERHLSVGEWAFVLVLDTPLACDFRHEPQKRGGLLVHWGRKGTFSVRHVLGLARAQWGSWGSGRRSQRVGPHGAQSAGICRRGVRVFGFVGHQRRCRGDSSHYGRGARAPGKLEGGGNPQWAGFPGACPGPAPELTVLES